MVNLILKPLKLLLSGLLFLLKCLFISILMIMPFGGWWIRSYDFNPKLRDLVVNWKKVFPANETTFPTLHDFRANWEKLFQPDDTPWWKFQHRESVDTDFNFYIHRFALMLYILPAIILPLWWLSSLCRRKDASSEPRKRKNKRVVVKDDESSLHSDDDSQSVISESDDDVVCPRNEGFSKPTTPLYKLIAVGDKKVLRQVPSSSDADDKNNKRNKEVKGCG